MGHQLRLLGPYLKPHTTFLEIGAGDCALSLHVAPRVGRVYGLDVSEEITRDLPTPGNFDLILSDGVSIPVTPGTVDIAYSNQLMEHLHPEDAEEQLSNIYTALAPGGAYMCITPNRLVGPSDISAYFDDVATGFHLKEYTNTELAGLCRRAGFTRTRSVVWLKWVAVSLPTALPGGLEFVLERRRQARLPAGRLRTQLERALGINMVAWKRES